MARFTDLDAVVSDPKQVKLGGKKYQLPGDIPAEDYIGFLRLEERFKEADNDQSIRILEEIHGKCLALFRVHHPDFDGAGITLPQVFAVFSAIIGLYEPGADDAAPPRSTRSRKS